MHVPAVRLHVRLALLGRAEGWERAGLPWGWERAGLRDVMHARRRRARVVISTLEITLETTRDRAELGRLGRARLRGAGHLRPLRGQVGPSRDLRSLVRGKGRGRGRG